MEKDVVCHLECPWFGGCLTITVLLFLYGAPYSKWYVHEEKINTCVSEYTISKRSVPHGDGLSVPEPPDNFVMYSDDDDSVSSNSEEQQTSASIDANNLQSTDSSNHKITEGELNDLIMDLELPKSKAELLASKLQQWNILHNSVV